MCRTSGEGFLLYASEKIASVCAMTSVVLCIVLIMCVSLSIGVGVGYHYCLIESKIVKEAEAMPGNRRRSFDGSDVAEEPDFDSYEPKPDTKQARESSAEDVNVVRKNMIADDNKYALTIPLHSNVDFMSLLSKLRSRNKNATLELVT